MTSVAILCSGIGLGFYIPGLVLHKQLLRKGVLSSIYVYEELLRREKVDSIAQIRNIFQSNFRIALMTQKLTKATSDCVDLNKLQVFIDDLQDRDANIIICFSGFWLPIISDYQEMCSDRPKTFCCHVDTIESISWRLYSSSRITCEHIFFNSWDMNDILFKINISEAPIVSFENRYHRFSVHGGGWSLGNFRDVADALNRQKFSLDIVSNNPEMERLPNNRYFYLPSSWSAWNRDSEGLLTFPPFYELSRTNEKIIIPNTTYPAGYDIMRQNLAIVSKPGGGTLIDSISSATPIVLLEPYGDYEKMNGRLWETLGFGISYARWRESQYSLSLLHEAHDRIVEKRAIVSEFINKVVSNST